MTVSSLEPVNNYTGNNSVKIFDFDFLIENEQELKVSILNLDTNVISELALGVDYSINEVGNKNGSYITFPLQSSSFDVLKENQIISLSLFLPIKQESEFENSADLKLDVLEWTFDYIIRILQVLNRKVERAIKINEGENYYSGDELVSSIFNYANKVENEAKMVSIKAEETFNYAKETFEVLETVENKANNNLDNLTQEGKKIIAENSGSSVPIGTIISLNSNLNYVPRGCLLCNGTEYNKSQFEQLWDDFLIEKEEKSLLMTCSYEEYAQELAANGQCSKFAVKPYGYDVSQLTIVGSPLITDDGIVSEFDTSNYLRTSNVDFSNANNWELRFKISLGEKPPININYGICGNGNSSFNLIYNSSSYVVFNMSPTISGASATSDMRFLAEENEIYDIIIGQNSDFTNFIKYKKASETEYLSGYSSGKYYPTKIMSINEALYIGAISSSGAQPAKNISLDLKEFKVIVDGQTILDCASGDTFKVPLLVSSDENLKYFVVVSNVQQDESKMNWSKWASSLNGKLNNDLSNCTKPYIIETSDETLMPSWYRIWSDGWCEQGGITTGGTTSTGKQVSLLKDLKDNYSLRTYVIGDSNSFNAAGTWVKTRAKTSSSFYIASGFTGASTSEYASYDCSWEAKGYLQ